MASRYDITIPQRATFIQEFQLLKQNEDGELVSNITVEDEFAAQFWDNGRENLLATFDVTADVNTGTVQISLSHVVTRTLRQNGQWDLLSYSNIDGGNRRYRLRGNVFIQPGNTDVEDTP